MCGITCFLKTPFLPISLFSQGVFSVRQAFLTTLINVAGVNVLHSFRRYRVLGLSLFCVYISICIAFSSLNLSTPIVSIKHGSCLDGWRKVHCGIELQC